MSRELVADELDLMARRLPLRGARVVELGCGKGEMARRLVQRGEVASMLAFETDGRQHTANLQSPSLPGLQFRAGGAQRIDLPEASTDIVLMLKSLHHVPVAELDAALDEVARILVPGGWLYVSEPVYAGPLNGIVALFHDEGAVRAAAYAALQRAPERGLLAWTDELRFDLPVRFRDYDDFVDRMVRVTHTDIRLDGAVETEVRRCFQAHCTAEGACFERPMRVNLLRRAVKPS